MKNKKVNALLFGAVSIMLLVPNYDAKIVETTKVEQKIVKAENQTDSVNFSDATLESEIAKALSVTVGEVTVADMDRLVNLSVPNLDITSLTGLEYAVNLETLNINNNKVSNLTPLTNLRKLNTLNATNNNISDLTPIADVLSLTYINLNGNHIYDCSPLQGILMINQATLIAMDNQTVTLPDIVVDNDDPITFDVFFIHGNKSTLTLGTPVAGVNIFTKGIGIDDLKTPFYVEVTQKVTLGSEPTKINAKPTATLNEGIVKSDEELIALFNANTDVSKVISVDQSSVNYNVPGTYDVVFSDATESITSKLTINDVLPVITLAKKSINIDLGNTIEDYITTFGVSATEINNSDLTPDIKVDETAVNYNSVGTYSVKFTVEDEEGNNVIKSGTVIINEVISEKETNNKSGKEANDTKVNKTSESKDIVASENSSDLKTSSKPMTVENKQTLASTGHLSTLFILGLTSMIIIFTIANKKLNSHQK